MIEEKLKNKVWGFLIIVNMLLLVIFAFVQPIIGTEPSVEILYVQIDEDVMVLDNGEALVIETGIKFLEVKKMLNFNIMNIAGALTTHLHL